MGWGNPWELLLGRRGSGNKRQRVLGAGNVHPWAGRHLQGHDPRIFQNAEVIEGRAGLEALGAKPCSRLGLRGTDKDRSSCQGSLHGSVLLSLLCPSATALSLCHCGVPLCPLCHCSVCPETALSPSVTALSPLSLLCHCSVPLCHCPVPSCHCSVTALCPPSLPCPSVTALSLCHCSVPFCPFCDGSVPLSLLCHCPVPPVTALSLAPGPWSSPWALCHHHCHGHGDPGGALGTEQSWL